MDKPSSAVQILGDDICGVDITIARTQRIDSELDYIILTVGKTEVYLSLECAAAVATVLMRAANRDVEVDHANIR
jgi:hypothetical protein